MHFQRKKIYKTIKNRVSERKKSKISVSEKILDLFQNRVPARSVSHEAVSHEALLYMYFQLFRIKTKFCWYIQQWNKILSYSQLPYIAFISFLAYQMRSLFYGLHVCKNHSHIMFVCIVLSVLSKVSYMDMAKKYKNDNVRLCI